MKKFPVIFLLLALLLNENKAIAQSEISVHIKNGVLLNKADQQKYSDLPVTKVRNTFQQSIGAAYTYVNKWGLLYTTGADIGYEGYRADFLYPSGRGIGQQLVYDDDYKLKATIPYVRINMGLGYRIKSSSWQPEIRLTQAFSIPLARQYFPDEYYYLQRPGMQGSVYAVEGEYGKISNGFMGELITGIYLGTHIPKDIKWVGNLNIGVQLQRNLFVKSYLNNYRVYYLEYANAINTEEFRGSHTSISLVLGIKL